MQSIYPLFELNRILKKEALTALRDYSYDHARLAYQYHAPGILTGCDVTVHGNELEVSPGILKHGDRILLLPEPERIPYMATDGLQYLTARIDTEDATPEFIAYQVTFVLAQTKVCKENEIELCRFHLRRGAELRCQYKDFFDLETEFDTINPIFAEWGGKGGQTLSPFITQMQRNMIDSYKDYSSEEYSKIAMGLIWQQQQYMPDSTEKYVARGSVLSCLKGSSKSKIDMLQDKGVYDNDNPVFTIDDCIVGENIHSFCTCQLCHESFGNRCVPQPVGRWMQTKSNVYAFSQQGGEYVELLKDSAALSCGRGGYMIIEETPIPLAGKQSETACYDAHRVEFQYSEDGRKAIFNYTQDQLEHFVE